MKGRRAERSARRSHIRTMPAQLALFDAGPELPEGFVYRAEFISLDEERELIARMAELRFEPFQFRGYEARRRVHAFGWRYDQGAAGLAQASAMPDWLLPLRDRAAAFAGVAGGAFAHVLINEYRVGAPIGWHRDRPQFDRVVGISLASPTVMRLRRRTEGGFTRINVPLAPRSAYLLSGPARQVWEHSIPEAEALRYSITFRNLR
jgi:alkylated DNA repair dioxygenase AlkB